jgi:hypothetical protein
VATPGRGANLYLTVSESADAGRIIQILGQMPSETKIFLGMAVLGLVGTLILLKGLI